MALIVLFLSVWIAAILLAPSVFRATARLSPIPKALLRATICSIAFGIGIIGGEGFALPGPLLGALIFYNGPQYYPYTALYPMVGWFAFFFLVFLVSALLSSKHGNKAASHPNE